MYVLHIDTPWKGKGHLGPKAKQWNYTYFMHAPLKKIWGTWGKTTKLHFFVCMPYILILLVMEMVISSKRTNYNTTPNSSINSLKNRGSRGKTTKLHCFLCVCPTYRHSMKGKRSSRTKGKTMKLHLFLACTLEKIWGTWGKTTKLHCFVCMPYILILLVMEKVIGSLR